MYEKTHQSLERHVRRVSLHRIATDTITVEWLRPVMDDQTKWPKPCLFKRLAGGLAQGGRTQYNKGADFDKSIFIVFDNLVKKQAAGGHIPNDVITALDLHPQRLWTIEDGSLMKKAYDLPQHHDSAVDVLVPDTPPTKQEMRQKRARSLRMSAKGVHKQLQPTKRKRPR
jgi:hypothetical protein